MQTCQHNVLYAHTLDLPVLSCDLRTNRQTKGTVGDKHGFGTALLHSQ